MGPVMVRNAQRRHIDINEDQIGSKLGRMGAKLGQNQGSGNGQFELLVGGERGTTTGRTSNINSAREHGVAACREEALTWALIPCWHGQLSKPMHVHVRQSAKISYTMEYSVKRPMHVHVRQSAENPYTMGYTVKRAIDH
jgi:hypothetical protein